MSANLFGEEVRESRRSQKPLASHQLIQHYRSLLEDRLEEATSEGGSLFGVFDCESYGALLAVIDPDNFAKDNWRRDVRLTPEDFEDSDPSDSLDN